MATTNCALTTTCHPVCRVPPNSDQTAAARVVEHMIGGRDDDSTFREAQRARRDMDDALTLLRALVQIGPNVQALTGLAQDDAAFVARVEARQ